VPSTSEETVTVTDQVPGETVVTQSMSVTVVPTTIVTVGTGPPVVSTGITYGVLPITRTVASTITTTGEPVTYVTFGVTEITSVYTITPVGPVPVEKNPDPVTQVITTVIGGEVRTIVDQGAPQTIVTGIPEVYSQVYVPPPETVVTRFGGTPTTMVITVIPAEETEAALMVVQTTIGGTLGTFFGVPPPQTIVTTIDGVLSTIISTPPPQIYTSIVGGTPTMVTIPAGQTGGFSPLTLTVVSQVGGVTVGTFVTTDAPQTIVTTVNGQETTMVITPAPRTFVSVTGGSLSTMVVTTTPIGTSPLSFTVVTNIGETISTFVTTPAPSTLVTTINGRLTTIVTTPNPTTILSTIKPSTATLTTVTTPTPTSKSGDGSSVVVEVGRYYLNDSLYFIGKFLPAMLAVILAIPLRVIDLNAKLYQPFYALTREGGAVGSHAMTLHYGGIKGFYAPFVTMMQGHPVPLLSTLVVWASSLLPPLATESLGLKLHGKCKINAIEGCALSLGVSPGPTHALVALIALIITLLLGLLYFLRNWETGLHANPWSIAGIASLAVSPDVRVHQPTEKKIHTAMDEKKYGLGFFENEHGRDDYGIILYDDVGQFLQGGNSAGASDTNRPNSDDQQESDFDGVYDASQGKPKKRHAVPFIALSYIWRAIFAFFLAALLTVVLYYHITLTRESSFKSFMNSQQFGARFFFAALGVIITFCWTSIFVSKYPLLLFLWLRCFLFG
jgi:hypothetical protein